MTRDDVEPLQWSEALAYSAAKFLEEYKGCTTHPGYIVDKPLDTVELDKLAFYDYHHRITYVPERMRPTDIEELVFDLFLDNETPNFENAKILWGNHINAIGIACDCHPVFEQICVIDVAHGVDLYGPLVHSHVEFLDEDGELLHDTFDEYTLVTPEFSLPDTNCPAPET